MEKENVDVLIIGAGPSGAVAAGYLNQQGVNIKVVEKQKFPRIVVGESLIPRVMDHFDEAGLLKALSSFDFEKKPGARFIRGEQQCVFDFSEKFGQGWDWTWQIPRADFDKAMTDELQRKGVDIAFETEVVDIQFNGTDSSTQVRDKTGDLSTIEAKFVLDCSGYGRVLPGMLQLGAPSKLNNHSAIFTHIQDVRRPSGEEGTQISFDIIDTKVWLWVIPFSNGRASVGIVGPTDYIEGLSSNPDNREAMEQAVKLSDHYVGRFDELPYEFDPIRLKNYSVSVSQFYGDGYALTGNSTEFLDPVFSSGVCFATESGILAAKLAKRQLAGEAINWKVEYADYMQAGIDVFSTYVREWYTGNLQELFFHQPENPDVKQKICAVLAGYVWNKDNPFVAKHHNIIKNMAYLIKK
ncbi:MAG: NAD(P)/FAD-dependent oxidoreductase [Sphingobacterium sp.]